MYCWCMWLLKLRLGLCFHILYTYSSNMWNSLNYTYNINFWHLSIFLIFFNSTQLYLQYQFLAPEYFVHFFQFNFIQAMCKIISTVLAILICSTWIFLLLFFFKFNFIQAICKIISIIFFHFSFLFLNSSLSIFQLPCLISQKLSLKERRQKRIMWKVNSQRKLNKKYQELSRNKTV